MRWERLEEDEKIGRRKEVEELYIRIKKERKGD